MHMAPKGPQRKNIILLAIIAAVVLYLAGVASGLFANKVLEQQTKADLQVLRNYIDGLDDSLQRIQLEQSFVDTLAEDEACRFSDITRQNLFSQLDYYWGRFPFRLESFERENELSEDYLLLKSKYTRLSLRAWTLVQQQYKKCNSEIIPLLYFYSLDCEVCIQQGEQLDQLRGAVGNLNLFIFTIDYASNESIVSLVKEYYRVERTPAIIVRDRVLQGRLFTADEILRNGDV